MPGGWWRNWLNRPRPDPDRANKSRRATFRPQIEVLENRTLMSWVVVTSMPTPRSALAAAVGADNRIYAIGGVDANGNPLATAEAYTTATNSWVTVTSLLMPLSWLAAAEGSDGRLYALGGTGASGVSNVVEAYKPSANTWTQVAHMLTPRSHLAVVSSSVDNRIYAIGGTDASGNPLSTVEAYNPKTNSWATVTPLPMPLTDLAAAEGSDKRIYVVGGSNSSGLSKVVLAYSPSTKVWTPVATILTPRSELAAATGADGRVYAIGGADSSGSPLNIVEAYTPTANSWATAVKLLVPRSGLAAVEGPDSRLYALAGNNGTTPVAEVEALTTVNPPGTTTVVSSSANPSVLGQSVTFTATVSPTGSSSGTPTGTVQFQIDGSNAGNPVTLGTTGGVTTASFTTSALAVGVHAVTAAYSGDSSFPASSGSLSGGEVVNSPVPPSNQAFLTQAYLDLLHRMPDPSGLAAFTAALNAGSTRFDVVMGIEASPEYRTLVVENLYEQYLGRAADPSGLSTGLAILNAGGTDEDVATFLTASPEYFQNRAGGSNDGFLNALYHDALGRAIDSSGQATYTRALNAGASRAVVATAVFTSIEYRIDLVNGYYQTFLRRAPDNGGLGSFVGDLDTGSSDEVVIAAIVGSDEYFQRL